MFNMYWINEIKNNYSIINDCYNVVVVEFGSEVVECFFKIWV